MLDWVGGVHLQGCSDAQVVSDKDLAWALMCAPWAAGALKQEEGGDGARQCVKAAL